MKKYSLLLLLLLTACVAIPQPSTFESPLLTNTQAKTYKVYLPLYSEAIPWTGISQDLAYRSCKTIQEFGATWHYDWSPYPLKCIGSEAVPMIWAPGDGKTKSLANSIYLLMFNECDGKGQCNTDPETAAKSWREYELLYPERKLVGPNISHEGLIWLLEFLNTYVRLYGEKPRIWALGVHCYMPVKECQDWTTVNINLAKEWTESGKVWVTEWAMTDCYIPGGDQAVVAAAEEFRNWLEHNPNVERQAWFIAYLPKQRCRTALIDNNGVLTDLGIWYQGAQ